MSNGRRPLVDEDDEDEMPSSGIDLWSIVQTVLGLLLFAVVLTTLILVIVHHSEKDHCCRSTKKYFQTLLDDNCTIIMNEDLPALLDVPGCYSFGEDLHYAGFPDPYAITIIGERITLNGRGFKLSLSGDGNGVNTHHSNNVLLNGVKIEFDAQRYCQSFYRLLQGRCFYVLESSRINIDDSACILGAQGFIVMNSSDITINRAYTYTHPKIADWTDEPILLTVGIFGMGDGYTQLKPTTLTIDGATLVSEPDDDIGMYPFITVGTAYQRGFSYVGFPESEVLALEGQGEYIVRNTLIRNQMLGYSCQRAKVCVLQDSEFVSHKLSFTTGMTLGSAAAVDSSMVSNVRVNMQTSGPGSDGIVVPDARGLVVDTFNIYGKFEPFFIPDTFLYHGAAIQVQMIGGLPEILPPGVQGLGNRHTNIIFSNGVVTLDGPDNIGVLIAKYLPWATTIPQSISFQNVAVANASVGMLLKDDANGIHVDRCTFRHNNIGILLENATEGTVISNSVFQHNCLGMDITAASLGTLTDHNLLTRNGAPSIIDVGSESVDHENIIASQTECSPVPLSTPIDLIPFYSFPEEASSSSMISGTVSMASFVDRIRKVKTGMFD